MSIRLPDYALPPPPLEPRARRTLAIFEHQVREQGGLLTGILLAFIFLVVVVPLIYTFFFAALVPSGFAPSTGLSTFYGPLGAGVWPFVLILLVSAVGATVIARDRATHAMTMYLARPIRPIDYLAAKSGAVGFWVFLGGVLPGWVGTVIVLALGYVSLPLSLEAIGAYLGVGLFAILAFTGLAVLLSAITSRSTLAGAGIFGTLLGSYVVMGVLSGISGRTSFLYLSPEHDLLAVAAGLFDVPGDPLSPWSAAGVLLAFAGATFGLTYLGLRRTQEVRE